MGGLEFVTLYRLTGDCADVVCQGSFSEVREWLRYAHFSDGLSARQLARDFVLSVWVSDTVREFWRLEASGRGRNAHLKAVYDGRI